jgi:hypothetical protein
VRLRPNRGSRAALGCDVTPINQSSESFTVLLVGYIRNSNESLGVDPPGRSQTGCPGSDGASPYPGASRVALGCDVTLQPPMPPSSGWFFDRFLGTV